MKYNKKGVFLTILGTSVGFLSVEVGDYIYDLPELATFGLIVGFIISFFGFIMIFLNKK